MSCKDNGCNHQCDIDVIACPCLRCGQELAYCGWCEKCQDQWPGSAKDDAMNETANNLQRSLEDLAKRIEDTHAIQSTIHATTWADATQLRDIVAALREQKEKILDVLSSQKFYDWYCDGGRFDNYIRGEENAPSRDDVLQDIEKFFSIDV